MPEDAVHTGNQVDSQQRRNTTMRPARTALASGQVAVRLGLAFSLMVGLLILVGDLGLHRTDQVNADLQAMVGGQWTKLRLAQEAMTYSNRNSRITMEIFLLRDLSQADALLAERARNTRRISALLEQLQLLCTTDEERRKLTAIADARQAYIENYQNALHLLIEERNREAASAMMLQQASPALVQYHAAWDEFARLQGTQLELAARQSTLLYTVARRRALWVMAFSVLATGVLALIVIRRMLQELTTHLLTDKNEIQSAHQEAELFINAVPSILVGLDRRGCITRWNAAAARTFGLSEAEVAGKHLFECGIPWMRTDMRNEIQSWLSGPSRRCDQVPFGRDAATRLLGLTITPLHQADTKPTRVLVIGSDITERNQLESQLHQAQKLESVGQLAAGIAHEINTPTQYIGDNVRFLQDAFADLKRLLSNYERLSVAGDGPSLSSQEIQEIADAVKQADPGYLLEEIPKAIEQTLEGVSRVSTLVSAMKEFSHPGTKDKVPLDLNHSIESTITVARNEWKYVADMETDFDSTLPLISCQPGEFNQVILNLIVNAAHAIGDLAGKQGGAKGTIKVQTRNGAEWAEIRIQDSGSGIPEHVRSRIFDPFFTTKEIGKGTGQGLAIARSVVVDKHNGTIHFETELGKGTTFIIRIPKDEESLAARAGTA